MIKNSLFKDNEINKLIYIIVETNELILSSDHEAMLEKRKQKIKNIYLKIYIYKDELFV